MNRLKLLWDLARLKSHERMTPARIKKYQAKRLRKILVYAFRHSSYHHRAFVKAGIDESNIRTAPLSAFPVMDKQTLLRNFDQIITVPDLTQDELRRFDAETAADRSAYKDKYHVVHSSGSTGKPGYFVYDEAAWRTMLLGIIRAALWGMSMKEIVKLLKNGPRIAYQEQATAAAVQRRAMWERTAQAEALEKTISNIGDLPKIRMVSASVITPEISLPAGANMFFLNM